MDIREIIMRYKYPIGGALILLIVSFIIHKSRGNKYQESATKISELTETATSVGGVISPQNYTQDYGEIKGLLDTLTGELKKSSSSLIQFNADRIKTNDYLNMRNNLFSRDIVVTKLLVDSKSLDHTAEFNPAQFTVRLGGQQSTDYPQGYKNVIGFRLLKCHIPVKPYHVVDGHNVLYDETGSQIGTALTLGSYTGVSLASELQTKLSASSVSYNSKTLKFTFTFPSSQKIDWSLSKLLAKTLGFLQAEKHFNTSASSDFSGDFTSSFVDLVIPEIPQIACKDNSKGLAVIDRIPLVQRADEGNLSYYQSNPSEYFTQNYFYPMKLSQLSVTLYLDTQDMVVYDTQKGETYFEFEITLLKNTSLMNQQIPPTQIK